MGLILLGGLFYTVGVYFYKQHKIKMNHFIWHLFIIGGAFSHYFAIYLMSSNWCLLHYLFEGFGLKEYNKMNAKREIIGAYEMTNLVLNLF